jgi:mono/diheme cytochrome c family protein
MMPGADARGILSPVFFEALNGKESPMKRIVSALFLVAFATAAQADGAAVFKARCAICHGADAAGGKIMPRPIKGTPEAKVLQMVQNGGGKMKKVSLSEEEAKEVAKYVSTLK